MSTHRLPDTSGLALPLGAPKKDHVRGKISLERSVSDKRVIEINRWLHGFSVAFCVPGAVFASLILLTITAHPVIAPVARPLLTALLRILGLHP
jgi:hypothetical protein